MCWGCLWTEGEAVETIPCTPQKLPLSPLHRCLRVMVRGHGPDWGEGSSERGGGTYAGTETTRG